MTLHFLILAIASALSFVFDFFDKRGKKIKYVFLIALVIFLAVFIGCRDLHVGIDTATYYSIYLRQDLSFSLTEISSPILILVSNFLGLDASQYFIVFAFLTLIGTLAFVHTHTKMNHALYTFLYITSFSFLYSCSAMRFFCALSFIIIACCYASKEKTVRSMLFLAIAMSFHFSAIIFIPVILFAKQRLNKNFWVLFMFCVFCLIALILAGDSFLKAILPAKYAYITFSGNVGFSTLKTILELVYLLSFRKTMTDNKKEYDFFLSIMAISILVDFLPGGYRIIWFFKFPAWFLWPMLITQMGKIPGKRMAVNKYLTIVLVIFVYTAWYAYQLSTMGVNQRVIPYGFMTQ